MVTTRQIEWWEKDKQRKLEQQRQTKFLIAQIFGWLTVVGMVAYNIWVDL